MNINIEDVRLDNASSFVNWNYCNGNFKFIALGKAAKNKLDLCNKQYYELPHPSGLNRKLNNKAWLKHELKKCEAWLKGTNAK